MDKLICFKNHKETLIQNMYDLFLNESLVNVTLVCQDQHYKAHQVILSACSPVFKKIFTKNVVPHPIVIFTDISREDMKLILDYIYNGEVKVKQDKVPVFLKAAEKLQLVGFNDCQIEHCLSLVNSTPNTNRKENKSSTENQDVQNLRESQMSPVLTDGLVEATFIAETDIVVDGPSMHSADENINSSNDKTRPQPRLATNISNPSKVVNPFAKLASQKDNSTRDKNDSESTFCEALDTVDPHEKIKEEVLGIRERSLSRDPYDSDIEIIENVAPSLVILNDTQLNVVPSLVVTNDSPLESPEWHRKTEPTKRSVRNHKELEESIYSSDESEIVQRPSKRRKKMEIPKSPPDTDNKGDSGQSKSRLHVNPIALKRTSSPKKTENIRKKNGSSKNSHDSNKQDNVDQSKEVYSNSERHISEKSLSGTSKDQSPKNRGSNKDNKESSTSKQTSNSEKSTSEKTSHKPSKPNLDITDLPFLKLHKYCVYHEKFCKDILKHIKKHHSYDRNTYICKKCSKQFRFKRFCKDSLKVHKCKN